jgi:hypothetical protein
VGLVVSVALFSNQVQYTGPLAGPVGDITPYVGFTLAALLTWLLAKVFQPRLGGALPADGVEVPAHTDAASTA